MVEFALNNAKSATTGYSPFMLMYGHEPRIPGILSDAALLAETSGVPDLEAFLRLQHLVLSAATRNILRAQSAQKEFADRARVDSPAFAVGDMVLLSNHSFALVKTEARWLGPFRVKDVLSSNTVRLSLPRTMAIHNVFNVDVLRKCTSSPASAVPVPPVLDPPKQIQMVVSSRAGPGRGGPLHLTVMYTDSDLDSVEEISLAQARKLSPELVDAYVAALPPKAKPTAAAKAVTPTS